MSVSLQVLPHRACAHCAFRGSAQRALQPGSHHNSACALHRSHLISHKAFLKYCRSQFPHRVVNLCFISVMMQDKLTDFGRS
jgi:hypothetical protein